MYGSFKCPLCGKICKRDQPAEDAWVEAILEFGRRMLTEPSDEVCELCYLRIIEAPPA